MQLPSPSIINGIVAIERLAEKLPWSAGGEVEGKMGTRKTVKKLLFRRGMIVSNAVKTAEIEAFLMRFRAHYVSVELIRIGGDGDGGYLVPDILKTASHCFSPGVSHTADFEFELSRSYGIRSFMADASVASAPLDDANFTFLKKFIGNCSQGDLITLGDWMDLSLEGEEKELILQMDIEGGEYDVLVYESAERLRRFSVMIIEFHDLERIFDPHFLKMFSSIFEKLYRYFSICHVHPNNRGGVVSLNGIEVPNVIEVTFVRNDYVDEVKTGDEIRLPHGLDHKNVADREDIKMPESWWK